MISQAGAYTEKSKGALKGRGDGVKCLLSMLEAQASSPAPITQALCLQTQNPSSWEIEAR